MVQVTFGLNPPSSVSNMFGTWLNGMSQKLKNHALVGYSAICWAIWLSRNDVVFNRSKVHSSQILFRGTHWIRFWSLLQKTKDRPLIKDACRRMETTMLEIYARFGWLFSNRVSA